MTQPNKRPLIWLLIAALAFLFLYEIRAILLPFVVGMLLAYVLNPAANRLEKAGLARAVASLLLIAAVFCAVITAGVFVVPLLARQGVALAAAIPDTLADLQARYLPQLQAWAAQIQPEQAQALKSAAKDVAANAVHVGGEVVSGAFASGFALFHVLSLLLITPLVAFYLLCDWHALTARTYKLLPVAHARTIRAQLRAIDTTLAGFLRGQITVCLLLAIYYGLALAAAGLQFGLAIGIASGLLVILPYLGIFFMALTALTVGLLQFGMTAPLAMVGGIYLVGQITEGYFLTPKLVGGRVGLHPLWIIFGMLSGATLFGLLGVLIAIPVTAALGVLIRFAADRYLRSELYRGK